MQVNSIIKYFVLFYLILCFLSCNKSPKKIEDTKEVQKEHEKKENIDFRLDANYMLSSTSDDLKKKDWFKSQTSIGNDEYDEWLEGDFYYSEDEWVKIIYGDVKGKHPNYLESNSNAFLKNSTLRIGDLLKNAIYRNSISVDYDEGNLILKDKNIQYHLDCSENTDVADFEIIIESKETNDKSIYPKSLDSCRVVFLRIYKKG
ncbi:hypothetical protein [Flavobacterium gawalongense]|uniref:Uncharacterized protein n=1 Tax=Flavobacterium gawalongense TaxID=2594432 RepID=A0A553BUB4_9FLAO|nr:hypothetical protein [Flavobacterium gawalongense]TRX02460.1 hypothetical protein FNW33_06505 [Flavobacterium gawalongense]TRX07712.1 hypothetical protein FNW12_05475 [Flavobacterium gawalongense]TRX11841.1 hypothetical protein FNW11_04510 [Flavobacterium gawalongense]TRX13021.1 hypothetical protein FNW10_03070 [Flavobacterium gawalongense]TRX31011.1 hypothetical protein FNW38_02180 [Flavobacterium gawalongense]